MLCFATHRKATILADCVVKIACDTEEFSGNMLIDDQFLRARHGFTDADLVKYRYDPDVEPPRLLAEASTHQTEFKRGDVKTLQDDLQRSKL